MGYAYLNMWEAGNLDTLLSFLLDQNPNDEVWEEGDTRSLIVGDIYNDDSVEGVWRLKGTVQDWLDDLLAE